MNPHKEFLLRPANLCDRVTVMRDIITEPGKTCRDYMSKHRSAGTAMRSFTRAGLVRVEQPRRGDPARYYPTPAGIEAYADITGEERPIASARAIGLHGVSLPALHGVQLS